MYKLIAVDVDGTLVGEDLCISPELMEIVEILRNRGVYFTLATGRALFSAMRFSRPLNIDIPMITFGGALISHPITGEVYYKIPLDPELAKKAYLILDKLNLHVNIQKIDGIFTNRLDEAANLYTSITSNQIHTFNSLDEALSREVLKLLVVSPQVELLENAEKMLHREMDGKIATARSLATFLEVINKDVSKGKALKFLGEMLGVKKEEIMAVGDHYNDLDMLEYAGLGVAMEVSPPEVKAAADHIEGNANHNGLAAILRRFALKDQ